MHTSGSKTAKFAERGRRRCYRPGIDQFEERLLLATFTVTSALDPTSGELSGTLRYVIDELNQSTDSTNTITFSIASGPQTITVQGSPLPAIIKPVLIDGTTQPGYSGKPLIQIDGQSNIPGDGLTLGLKSDGSTIKGLSIFNFPYGAGIHIESDGNVVESNYLGAPGSPNFYGIEIENSYTNTIGGTTDGAGNVVAGNAGTGLAITEPSQITPPMGTGTQILGNRFGTDITGTKYIAMNSGNGISLVNCTNVTIGSVVSSGRNVVSTNEGNGIALTDCSNNIQILDNAIGTDINGHQGAMFYNQGDGIDMVGCAGVTVGGAATGAGNVVSSNEGSGITLTSSDHIQILGNTIGTRIFLGPYSSPGNYGNGVEISGEGAEFDLVQGNVIDFNFGDGVLIGGNGPNQNTIASNTISANAGNGVELAGINNNPDNPKGNLVQDNAIAGNAGDGVFIGSQSSYNIIGGTAALDANTIFSNKSNGIQITGDYNLVEGNFIGTNSSGTTPAGNLGDGVLIIAQATGNTIGGTAGGSRNIISGNHANGVQIFGGGLGYGAGNTVQGNYIGTDESGTIPVPNLEDGVSIIGAEPTDGYITIGGNLVSGNAENGISIDASTGIQIDGNYIGTDKNGTSALPNTLNGVLVRNSGNTSLGNTIGGTTAATRNVISGNKLVGIQILSSTGTLVEGDYIGTDKSGTDALQTQQYGIWVVNSFSSDPGTPANTIGGTTAGACNVISGNLNYGILLALSSGTLIEGNLIGTDATGRLARGNTVGVLIFDASGNFVGGAVAGAGNVISANTLYGIAISGTNSTGNQVSGNLIGPGAGETPFPVRGQNAALWFQADNPWLQQVGVFITDSVGNTVGGSKSGSKNVISGNNTGVEVSGFNSALQSSNSSNAIMGNSIGVTPKETNVGNVTGIWLNNVPSNTIGGTVAGAGNTISGNSQGGVYISGANATKNLVQGNTISGLGPGGKPYYPATDRDPTYQFPIGVYIEDSSSNFIGGTATGAGNAISGNSVGVYVFGSAGSSQGNTISGNVINSGQVINSERYGVLLYNAPYNTTSPNQIGYAGIAKFREFSGPVAPVTPMQTSSSGQAKRTTAKKPARRSSRAAHPSGRRTTPLAAVTVHGRQIPAGPMRKPRA